MNRTEKAIEAQRQVMLGLDRDVARAIIYDHQIILRSLQSSMASITAKIEEAKRIGIEPTINWLVQQRRYHEMLDQLERHTLSFLTKTNQHIIVAQGKAITLAERQAEKLTLAVLPPSSPAATAYVRGTFNRLPAARIAGIIGKTRAGTPLGELLSGLGQQAAQDVRDTLLSGVSRGQGVRDIGRDVAQAARMPLTRALTIARTEVIGTYRDVASHQYANSPVVTGWIWDAALDERTCVICWEMTGQHFSDTETLDSHANCRCAQIPETRSWNELGFSGIPDTQPAALIEPGASQFANLSEKAQRTVLGPTRFDAYKSGKVGLNDMVRMTQSPRWGQGRRAATLQELGL